MVCTCTFLSSGVINYEFLCRKGSKWWRYVEKIGCAGYFGTYKSMVGFLTFMEG